MSHNLVGLVGRPNILTQFAALWPRPSPTALPQGLALIGLDEARLDSLSVSEGPSIAGFIYLHAEMVRTIASLGSGADPWLYFEMRYFGGTGQQAAALFCAGSEQWHRTSGDVQQRDMSRKSPISEGLAEMGVKRGLLDDEFAGIGLGKFRSLDDLGF